ncbi:hypothetical protein ACX1C1_08965 [Paenibacillus sp. strain BS8-2]
MMKESRAMHIAEEDMRKYASGTLRGAERERVDAELLHCRQCLELFMSMLESETNRADTEERGLPLSDWQALEERVIEELKLAEPAKLSASHRPAVQQKPAARRVPWIQKPAWQYTIAASITLLLLASGALAGFSQSLEKLDESRVAMPSQSDIDKAWENQPSWSEQLVNRTGGWLDGIQASRFK